MAGWQLAVVLALRCDQVATDVPLEVADTGWSIITVYLGPRGFAMSHLLTAGHKKPSFYWGLAPHDPAFGRVMGLT